MQPGHSWFLLLPCRYQVRAILLFFSNFLFYMCTKMSNRPARENIDRSDSSPSWSRTKQTLLDLITPITPSFRTDKSILKGELALTVMKIRVIWIVV